LLPWNIKNINPEFSKAQLTNVNFNNFKMIEAIIKSHCIEVPLNGITSVPNFMKIYQAIQKLLVGDIQTDKQTGDFISLLSFF
jgi:ubiquitin C-terminal hydrolase